MVRGACVMRGSRFLVGTLFFLYLTLKNTEVRKAIPIFFKGGGHKFTEFACLDDHKNN